MSGAARRARLRFGSGMPDTLAISSGSAVPVWCDVLDVLTGQAAIADGVTFRWLPPDRGAEIRQEATREDTGAWFASLALDMPGLWIIRAEVTGGAIIAERWVKVTPTQFSDDTSPAPLLVTDDGEVLLLDSGAAMGG